MNAILKNNTVEEEEDPAKERQIGQIVSLLQQPPDQPPSVEEAPLLMPPTGQHQQSPEPIGQPCADLCHQYSPPAAVDVDGIREMMGMGGGGN